MLDAFLQGLLAAMSSGLGALLGIFWQPSRVLSAAIMAFGSGTLLSALAFETTISAYRESGFLPLLIGFLIGGGLFIGITRFVDDKGGFLRKASSRRRYLFEHRQEETGDVLDRIAHVEVMQNLPPSEAQAIVPLLKPISIKEGEALFHEGDKGDSFYMIIHGEAEVKKGEKVMTTLGSGEVFGEMALLNSEPRSATVIASTDMDVYQLKQEHFDDVLLKSPSIANALSRALAKRLRSTTASRAEAEQNLDLWRQQAIDSVEIDLSPSEEQKMIQGLVKSSAPLAILVGTLIDGIPESTVIGMTAQPGHVGWSFLMAVFISNFPEALSSSIGMKQAGTKNLRIMLLWAGVILLSGLCALLGNVLAANTSDLVVALAQAVSGGAILAMLASTMMPEAYELGGGSVAFSTIMGFLTGFFISAPHLPPVTGL
ncbi:cyclic nucleotide-binding domain-containing protein [Tumidithrix elongata RA019]|uniref:Cyclic nucleotide-binding domain-containing protein n=1 Tax=Tumidithrix elongata BACA0141 TaxID=2716417 RepID=A0AAW9Q3T1_9CYAN|nr:cyclic nucleotide-binding domain-containing protein [Tumidithrix elongata RA019]